MKPENTYVDTGEKIIINPYNECEFLYVFNKEDSSMTTHRCGNDKNNTFFNELKEFHDYLAQKRTEIQEEPEATTYLELSGVSSLFNKKELSDLHMHLNQYLDELSSFLIFKENLFSYELEKFKNNND